MKTPSPIKLPHQILRTPSPQTPDDIKEWLNTVARKRLSIVLTAVGIIDIRTPEKTTANLLSTALSMDSSNSTKGCIYAFVIMQALRLNERGGDTSREVFTAEPKFFLDQGTNQPLTIQLKISRIAKRDPHNRKKISIYDVDIDTLLEHGDLSRKTKQRSHPRGLKDLGDLDEFFEAALIAFS